MPLPIYLKIVLFHNNIEVANGVKFVAHDSVHGVDNNDFRSGVVTDENRTT